MYEKAVWLFRRGQLVEHSSAIGNPQISKFGTSIPKSSKGRVIGIGINSQERDEMRSMAAVAHGLFNHAGP